MAVDLQGPPQPGPFVRIVGIGIDLMMTVNDEDDLLILALAVRIANKRRFGKNSNGRRSGEPKMLQRR